MAPLPSGVIARRAGVRLRSVRATRPCPERKLLGRVVEARAAREAAAREAGAEALLVDTAGVATETTTANVLGCTAAGLVDPGTGLWGWRGPSSWLPPPDGACPSPGAASGLPTWRPAR
ncbi:MAG: hypothetical protein R3F60_05630 [bacterium]